MTINAHDITRVLLADGWHAPEAGTVEWEVCTFDSPEDLTVTVMTWIEVRGNPADPNARIQVVTPFSELLAFEVR